MKDYVMSASGIVIRVASAVIFFFVFSGTSRACEQPVLNKNVSLEELSDSGFRIDWNPVSNAKFYELKYILRIPEGRTLMQKEATAAEAFYRFSADELRQADVLQLIVEVTTRCGTSKSTPAFAQISFKNRASACGFDQQVPALKSDELSWPPIKAAQSYVMCFYKERRQTFCHETASTQNKILLESTPLIGVTPICNNVGGTPVYISVEKNSPENLR